MPSLDQAQQVVGTVATAAPASWSLAMSFVLGALAMLGIMLGAQEVIRRNKANSPNRCKHCQGSGSEPEKKKTGEPCDDCNGTGQTEEEQEGVECKHCEGEGEDPCHVCKGSGKDASGQECAACKGEGKTLTGKLDKDGEDVVADCEICRGEGEVSNPIKKKVSCDTCGGTGKT
jgi:DnaJ-class molecular chaperone